jgi:polar amino acid transport system substrate-binding protein
LRLTVLFGLAALGAGAWAAEPAPPLPALNSYAQPPFTLPGEPEGGLAARLVARLNEEAAEPAGFRVELQPRRRLEMTLEAADFAGLALFLAPEFLPPELARSGAWSAPVMVDENLIVSARPLALTSLEQLDGLRFGAIAGHVYRRLDPIVEAGRLARADAPDHVANLRKLCLDRVDFVVISRSELAGTAPLAACARPWHFMPFPQPQIILRRVLVRLPDPQRTQAVLAAVARVACGERWRAALASYGLATVGCAARPAARTPG